MWHCVDMLIYVNHFAYQRKPNNLFWRKSFFLSEMIEFWILTMFSQYILITLEMFQKFTSILKM